MKFIHLSDLHIGKRVNEFPMYEDQEYILTEIIKIIDNEKPDAVLIAGDIYDKSIPPSDAVTMFDAFLVLLSKRNLKVFVISGNHDSPERLSFCSRLIEKSGVYFSPVYNGHIAPVKLEDEYGEVNIYMLPFVKPANVRRFFDDREILSYTDAMEVAISEMNVNLESRNVLVTHQFVTGADRTESEEISVGGTDNVDVSVFDDFDYVALGHIHRPQNCLSKRVRYCGTPLKYSFSEANDKKSVTIVELKEKGSLEIRTADLVPKHEMREIKGKYEEITAKSFYENTTYQTDYMHITLTDEENIPYGVGKLRTIYHNLMKLDYDNMRTRSNSQITGAQNIEEKSPLELFEDFYEMQNNQPMSEEQRDYISSLIESVWEEEI
ncbi:exonuclease SbcCD subunit D [Ruminococcus sp.]|uniref:exonuclease SbcCD subunit D n=1 Tax=Ruminococcus sp. TaxID=41978 RepID=UPI00262FF2FD|nr:exonuclease SbcCD subunit D [Ruminococcus sp.]MDD6988735.1 exonuclease SbcCD subunit D [Ruminococcus sp.]MDY6201485.1 exonuclease SbcCD subunit D [Ruminococcus sp.]